MPADRGKGSEHGNVRRDEGGLGAERVGGQSRLRSREGRDFDNCNSLPCRRVSSGTVVVVDEQEKPTGMDREGHARVRVRFDTFLKFTRNVGTGQRGAASAS